MLSFCPHYRYEKEDKFQEDHGPMSSRLSFRACAILVILVAMFARPPGASAEEYQLKPGDIVEITVLEDPNLNRRVLVGPDGNIAMPLAGTLKAGGRSLTQLQSAISTRLRGQFVNPPSVTASLVALGPPDGSSPDDGDPSDISTVFVLGEVQRPGRYEYTSDKPVSVLQALAMAGGPGVFAARQRIQVRVSDEETEQVRLFNYAALEDGKTVETPFMLEDGAVIVVPERGLFE